MLKLLTLTVFFGFFFKFGLGAKLAELAEQASQSDRCGHWRKRNRHGGANVYRASFKNIWTSLHH